MVATWCSNVYGTKTWIKSKTRPPCLVHVIKGSFFSKDRNRTESIVYLSQPHKFTNNLCPPPKKKPPKCKYKSTPLLNPIVEASKCAYMQFIWSKTHIRNQVFESKTHHLEDQTLDEVRGKQREKRETQVKVTFPMASKREALKEAAVRITWGKLVAPGTILLKCVPGPT